MSSLSGTEGGKYIVLVCEDRSLRIWSMKVGDCVGIPPMDGYLIHSVAVKKDRKYLISGSVDGTLEMWSLHLGNREKVLAERKKCVR